MRCHVALVEAGLANPLYRQEVYTTAHSQLMLMTLQPGEEIGLEKHRGDQLLVCLAGQGAFVVEPGTSEQPDLQAAQSACDAPPESSDLASDLSESPRSQNDVLVSSEQGHLVAGQAVMVPAGCPHNIINTGNTPLKLYTVYSPPQHAAGTVHRTKADATAAEASEATQASERAKAASRWRSEASHMPADVPLGSLFGR
ncbi:MAG: cupin domain-containing protein [Candidatus Sericytochromatia bacterium]|nr:cupin domain-containing protein [Candidatus Sericytochromatia bacterium]